MSGETLCRGVSGIVSWSSWWGDVEFVDDESGEVEYHFGPVAHVEFAGGTSRRFQALTVGQLNEQIRSLGIEVEYHPDWLDHVECLCERCR